MWCFSASPSLRQHGTFFSVFSVFAHFKRKNGKPKSQSTATAVSVSPARYL
jgi:hypothetical protein